MSSIYRLRIPDSVVSLIRNMHPQLRKKIRAGLDDIITNPECGKKLQLELSGLRSYRVNRFRIIYRLGPVKTVELVAVGPRKTIYEETYRLVRSCP